MQRRVGTFSHNFLHSFSNVFLWCLKLIKKKLLQVASSALRKVTEEVKDRIPATARSLEAMVVRHPLARLVSAYRFPLYIFFHKTSMWLINTAISCSFLVSYLHFTFYLCLEFVQSTKLIHHN